MSTLDLSNERLHVTLLFQFWVQLVAHRSCRKILHDYAARQSQRIPIPPIVTILSQCRSRSGLLRANELFPMPGTPKSPGFWHADLHPTYLFSFTPSDLRPIEYFRSAFWESLD
jgi:hypothetical protein